MALVPASSRGAPPFNGGTITTGLEIDNGVNGTDTLHLVAPTSGGGDLIGVYDHSNNQLLQFDSVGGFYLAQQPFQVYTAGFSGTLFAVSSSFVRSTVPVRIEAVAAPSDASLAASTVALWFDDTNGVGNTKLMVKGKSADGTVKTATILLA